MATRPSRSAQRRGGELLADTLAQIERGWPAGLTLLTGEDLYHLDRAQRALLAWLAPRESSSFGLTVYGEDKVDLSTVIAAARSVGMFAERRVVLAREVAALEGDVEALNDYTRNPPPNSYLIVRAPSLDKRRKLHKALLAAGQVLNFEAASEYEAQRLVGDVARIAAGKGLTLDRSSTAFLAQICLGDLYRVDSELEKLCSWLGGSPRKVTLEQVRQVVAGGGLVSGWEVADAILLRDRPRALAALRSLIQAGDEPIRIVGALAYRARTMLQAKALMAQGRSAEQAVQAVRAWGYRDQLAQGLSRYSLAELLGFPRLLLQADRTLKSRALDSGAVLEELVERLTA